MTRNRVITFALAAALLLVPLMGAKGCGTNTPIRRVGGPIPQGQGYPVRSNGTVYWIGRIPPKPLVGTEWKPGGFTKRNHRPIWVRVPR